MNILRRYFIRQVQHIYLLGKENSEMSCQNPFWNNLFLNSRPLVFCVCVCVCARACASAKSLQSCPTLCDSMDCNPPCSSVHGASPGKNTGVGCHALLQGTFLTQRENQRLLHLLHWQVGFFTTSATWEACRKR